MSGVVYLFRFTGDVTSNIPYVTKSTNETDEEEGINSERIRMMINFEKEGYIVNNNPGLPTETPFLIYEEPGKPALKVELRFNIESACILSGTSVLCQSLSSPISKVLSGKPIRARGFLEGGVLNVSVLETTQVSTTTPEF